MIVAIIPARSGSKRIPNKNIRKTAGLREDQKHYRVIISKNSTSIKLAPPLLVNSNATAFYSNQTSPEFTRRGGWGVRSKQRRSIPEAALCRHDVTFLTSLFSSKGIAP